MLVPTLVLLWIIFLAGVLSLEEVLGSVRLNERYHFVRESKLAFSFPCRLEHSADGSLSTFSFPSIPM